MVDVIVAFSQHCPSPLTPVTRHILDERSLKYDTDSNE
jgi:hypothetical protein